jgi:hypothetical protein
LADAETKRDRAGVDLAELLAPEADHGWLKVTEMANVIAVKTTSYLADFKPIQ